MKSQLFSWQAESPPWERLLEDAVDGVLVDSEDHVIYANTAYALLLGYRRGADLFRKPISELVASVDLDRVLKYGRMRAAGKRVPASYDFAAHTKDGSTVRLNASVSASIVHSRVYIITIARPFPATGSVSAMAPVAGLHLTLSSTERQVMERILAGVRSKVIAYELGMSEKTVGTHRARLLAKIGASDSRELFQYALRHGLVDWS